jgi:hypothetical protein
VYDDAAGQVRLGQASSEQVGVTWLGLVVAGKVERHGTLWEPRHGLEQAVDPFAAHPVGDA